MNVQTHANPDEKQSPPWLGRTNLFSAVLAATVLIPLARPAVEGAEIIDLGSLPGYNMSVAQAINASGHVVGYVHNGSGQRAVLYDGTLHDLGTLGGNSWARAINGSGQIGGVSNNHAFLYDNGVMFDLGTLGGFYSDVNGMNDVGQLVGSSLAPSGWRAHLYQNGVMQAINLSSITAGGNEFATAINNLGQVTGGTSSDSNGPPSRGYIYDSNTNTLINIGSLGNNSNTAGSAINDWSQVAGRSVTLGGQTHAFLYDNGVMHDLGTLGGSFSNGMGVNNLGQVVGDSTTSTGASHAFLYTDGAMVDLNDLVPGSGWTLVNALGINDSGQIVGWGFNPDDVMRGFIYIPDPVVPPPIPVEIDIKPGSDPNSINLNAKGVLPVAIFSAEDFDALSIDEATVGLGDPELILDGATPVAPIRSSIEDVDGDGLDDLVLHFSVADFTANGALDSDSVEVILLGETFDGVAISGMDAVRIVITKK
jgi:probable HAF family extracellular repeat protein